VEGGFDPLTIAPDRREGAAHSGKGIIPLARGLDLSTERSIFKLTKPFTLKYTVLLFVAIFAVNFANAQSATLIGNCRFVGPDPGRGTSLLIGSDVQLYHNGSFKRTSIGGGVEYYTGNGDLWIIYRNPKARSKYSFKTSNGKVQTCDSF
jgi:hypothetical protein